MTGCSRVFKSEPALKRHQTAVHVVPDALHPRHAVNLTQNTRNEDTGSPAEDMDVPFESNVLPDPEDGHHYGLYTETHPILDGECAVF